MRTLYKVAKMYKIAQDFAMPNEKIKDKLDSFARTQVENFYDKEINSPGAPEDSVTVSVSTIVKKTGPILFQLL